MISVLLRPLLLRPLQLDIVTSLAVLTFLRPHSLAVAYWRLVEAVQRHVEDHRFVSVPECLPLTAGRLVHLDQAKDRFDKGRQGRKTTAVDALDSVSFMQL